MMKAIVLKIVESKFSTVGIPSNNLKDIGMNCVKNGYNYLFS